MEPMCVVIRDNNNELADWHFYCYVTFLTIGSIRSAIESAVMSSNYISLYFKMTSL